MAIDVFSPEVEEDLLTATFFLRNDLLFGINAILIQEMVMVGELTTVRHAPDFVAGIRNLRGRIITVIDLAVRLGIGSVEIGPDSRILIADWKGEPVGLLVDRVSDPIALAPDDLEPAPSNLNGVQMQKLLGVFRSGERLAALLDPVAIFGHDDQPGESLPHEEKRG
jgi:purine-binding chemotaxis protein CheW